MRGGALKRTSFGDLWCHVVCAAFAPEIHFQEAYHRDLVNISNITEERKQLVGILIPHFSLVIVQLGHSHYILCSTDPTKGFSGFSEEIKKNLTPIRSEKF